MTAAKRQLGAGRRRPRLRRRPVRFPGRADPPHLRLHHASTSIASKNPSTAERMAVVAQGGYGRGTAGAGLRHRSPVPAALQADRLGRERRRIHALSVVGSRLQGRPRHAHHRRNASGSACADMTIRTALLDARLILGDEQLFDDFQQTLPQGRRWTADARAFIEAKLAEQNARHSRAGASRYLVEPNIKEGNGGLRDLHTLALARQASLSRQGRGRVRRGRRLHPPRVSQLPPLRVLPVDGALPSAFPHRPARGAPELRPAAGHGRAARLSRSCRLERRSSAS